MVASPRILDSRHPVLLLGTQRSEDALSKALDRWQIDGPVGLIAAGWEEDEFEDEWVRQRVHQPVINSQLYELADQMFVEDPEVIQLLRGRQDELRRLRWINEPQMARLLANARALLVRQASGEDVDAFLALAFDQVRELDERYLEEVQKTIGIYDERIGPDARPSISTYRQRVLGRLNECRCLLIAGGHVGVLLNRLNLSRLLRDVDLPVIAWGGGTMALASKVVFFHQRLPHESDDAELSRRGLGKFDSLLPFPNAVERLRLDDPLEVALLANRFRDDVCLAMGESSEMEGVQGQWSRATGIRCLETTGHLSDWTLP